MKSLIILIHQKGTINKAIVAHCLVCDSVQLKSKTTRELFKKENLGKN